MLRRILASAFIAALISTPAWAYVHRESVEKVIPAEGLTSIRVINPNGLIKIRPAGGSEVMLEAKKIAKGKDEDEAVKLAEAARVRVVEGGDRIEIEVELPSREKHKSILGEVLNLSASRNVMVELYLEVPASMELDLSSTSGDVDVEGSLAGGHIGATSGDVLLADCSGDFVIGVASGDMEIERIQGNLQLSSASGNIAVGEVDGRVDVSTASGDFTAKGIEKSLMLDGASGEVTVDDCKGRVEVSTASGDVWLKSVSGEVTVNTSSGDVTVYIADKRNIDVEINCSSGDVEFAAPSGSSYHLEITSVSGAIYCKAPLSVEKVTRRELRGDVGSGSGTVILGTSSGDIRVLEGDDHAG
jgi:DUF4097 and DUF4098 domain-containing protein YvlB